MGISQFEKNKASLEIVEQLRRLRNQIVHGIEPPSTNDLRHSITLLKTLLLNLKNQSSERVQKVINSSDRIQNELKEAIEELGN